MRVSPTNIYNMFIVPEFMWYLGKNEISIIEQDPKHYDDYFLPRENDGAIKEPEPEKPKLVLAYKAFCEEHKAWLEEICANTEINLQSVPVMNMVIRAVMGQQYKEEKVNRLEKSVIPREQKEHDDGCKVFRGDSRLFFLIDDVDGKSDSASPDKHDNNQRESDDESDGEYEGAFQMDDIRDDSNCNDAAANNVNANNQNNERGYGRNPPNTDFFDRVSCNNRWGGADDVNAPSLTYLGVSTQE